MSAGAESHKREYPSPGMISSWNLQHQWRVHQGDKQRKAYQLPRVQAAHFNQSR